MEVAGSIVQVSRGRQAIADHYNVQRTVAVNVSRLDVCGVVIHTAKTAQVRRVAAVTRIAGGDEVAVSVVKVDDTRPGKPAADNIQRTIAVEISHRNAES